MVNPYEDTYTAEHRSFQALLEEGEPLVSTVIPAYNKAEFVVETLECAISQDYPNHEILIVNDGSTDNTAEIVRDFAEKHSNKKVRLLDKENGGTSSAKNHGINFASARIVHTLDSDDIISPKYISTGIEMMRESRSNLFCSNIDIFGVREGEWIPHDYNPALIRYDNCISMSQIFDRVLWERAGGFNVSFAFVEDWELWIRFSRHGLKVARADEKMIKYRSGEEGLANTFVYDYWSECLALVMTANEDLYAIEEILEAHEKLKKMPDVFIDKLTSLDKKHPRQWILKFWRALSEENEARKNKAMDLYTEAALLSEDRNWQPYYRLACLFEKAGYYQQMNPLLQKVRLLRPDLNRIVNQKIQQLLEVLGATQKK